MLTWGILGALILRGLMITGGIRLLHFWHPVVYIFGAFLAYSGVRTLVGARRRRRRGSARQALGARAAALSADRAALRGQPASSSRGEDGGAAARMLLFALIVIELSDLMFAVDSIPAVLGVTDDMQIVFSSNVLAVLGLRALYLVVEHLMAKLRYLRFGVGAILIIVGAKMCLDERRARAAAGRARRHARHPRRSPRWRRWSSDRRKPRTERRRRPLRVERAALALLGAPLERRQEAEVDVGRRERLARWRAAA